MKVTPGIKFPFQLFGLSVVITNESPWQRKSMQHVEMQGGSCVFVVAHKACVEILESDFKFNQGLARVVNF